MNLSRYHKLFLMSVVLISMVVSPITLSAKTVQQPNVPMQELVMGNTAFALDFFQFMTTYEEGNFVFSPYSLSNAFAMTFAGARENTGGEIRDVFHFDLPPNELHRAFSALTILLNDPDRESRIVVANALWGERTFQFAPEYQQLMLNSYSNGFRLVDFANAPDQATEEINQWVSNITEGKISELIPTGALDNLTRLVITNALLFRGDWLFPFDTSATSDGSFYGFDGEVTVPMMSANEMAFGCTGGDEEYDYIAVRLPYSDESSSFVIIMPDEKSYDDFLDNFFGETFTDVLYNMDSCFGKITMPKFSVQTGIGLKDILSEMGIIEAFSPLANFAGMSNAPELYISEALHQARIDVNEAGTEAAAATAVVMGVRSGGAVDLVIDSPFFFAVLDNATDTILFMGNMIDPSAD
ncbi:MAG: serpin family protein [Phototrophicales bacterium]|nr:serpin family protein [Phototrophicales bacterium]